MTQGSGKSTLEPSRAMLEACDVHTYYGDSHVLQGVSLKVERGSITALLGRNGVGKTTLLHSIIGFVPPRKGKIVLKGADITCRPAYQIARMGIGLVPQGRRVFPSLNVKENLQIAARSPQQNPIHAWNLKTIFGLFPRLGERSHQGASKLSGGEQEMLATGRALMGHPECLLMDEPTEGLAPIIVQELGRLIERLKGLHLSILLVEQNLAFALKHADYVYIMSKGKIVYHSTPDEIRENADIRSRYLGV